jgi:hypothetical protein
MLVYVSSRTTDGDGGDGWWRFDASSSATANGGTILAPDAGSGRWLRIENTPVSVKWFGAKGDGSTNDTSAIQLAIDYAEDVVGDAGVVVRFPKGDYVHGALLVSVSGVRLEAEGDVRLLKNTTTGNGLEFKAPGYPADPTARIFRCGFVGFTIGNKSANGSSGANVYFQNVGDSDFQNNRFQQFPFKPFTAFRFDRCTNLTFTNNKGSDTVSTGVIFQECGGLFGTSNISNVCGVDGFEFDSVTGNYLSKVQGYGNVRHGTKIHSTISSSNISNQSAFYLIESWDMDTNGNHNWSITDLNVSTLTNCWGSTQSGSTTNVCGFAFAGTCSDVDLIGCKALKNNASGVEVGSSCVNINFIGGTYVSNGAQSGSTTRVGVLHQGAGFIKGVTAKNIATYGLTQQYGLSAALGAAGNMMRVESCSLSGNAVGPIMTISATNYTDFAEDDNSTGVSISVASATTLATPTLGRFFSVTGTDDIYDITPKWRGRRVSLTFTSTARFVGGASLRITAATLTPAQYGTAEFIFDGASWILLSSSVNDNA